MNGPPPALNGKGPAGVSLDSLAQAYRAGGATPSPSQLDPFSPVLDVLAGSQADARAKAHLVYRDLPLVTIQNTWSVDQARGALYAHLQGQFENSSQLWDSILGDDRVMATLGSRVAGLFGREVRFAPADDSDAAAKCCAAWKKWWPRLFGGSGLKVVHKQAIGLGMAPAQLVWDTSGEVWGPYVRPWHARYTYFDWGIRRLVAISLDGTTPIIPGDGKWLLHAPNGDYLGWYSGAIRAVTEPWMLRHFAFRDMARFSEVHGLPTRVGNVPIVGDPAERKAFEDALQGLGSDAAMIVPQGIDGINGFSYSLVEAKDTAWESFGQLIDRCDMAIVLALLFQNLTTEVKGGSFAATEAHMDIRESGLQDDNAAWRETIYAQIARPFAWLNFGDPDLAPHTWFDVVPREETVYAAKQFQQFGTALEVLARGGIKFKDVEALRSFAAKTFGLDGLPDFTIGDPVVGGLGGGAKSKLPFTDVDPAQVVKVNEARALNDLPAIPDGDITIAEFTTKNAAKHKTPATTAADAKPVQSAPSSSGAKGPGK